MLYTTDVVRWLQAFPSFPVEDGFPVPIEVPTQPVDTPNRLIYLSIGPGPPTLDERTLDVHSIDLRCRGPQADDDGAERFMAAIDNIVMGVVCPVTIGRRVHDIDYAGGPPQFLLLDPARRSHFVGRYLITIEREVF